MLQGDKKEIPTICLSHKLFELNPKLYLDNLRVLSKIYPKDELKEILNDNSEYNTWCSPPLIWVVYMTGSFNKKNYKYRFFGHKTILSNKLGIEIVNELIKHGANVDIENYYQPKDINSQ